jgi:hypothetical protein
LTDTREAPRVSASPAWAPGKGTGRRGGWPRGRAGGQGLRTYLADYLRAERDLGRLAPQADPDMAATMIIGACHEVVLPTLLRGDAATEIEVPDGFADDLVAAVMTGIGPRD